MIIKKIAAEARVKISGWVSDQNRAGTVPTISFDVLERILARSLPTFAERADRLLLEAVRGQEKLGSQFDITEPRFIAATYSQDADEVYFLSRMLSDQGLMQDISIGGRSEVLPQGYVAANELTRRVINDEMIAQIRAASFVVADFTGHRGGVYFEAGFALGLDLPVIWTCRKDHMKDLHFDIRQYNTIDWEDSEDLATRLQHRIEATVGKGPKTVLGPWPCENARQR